MCVTISGYGVPSGTRSGAKICVDPHANHNEVPRAELDLVLRWVQARFDGAPLDVEVFDTPRCSDVAALDVDGQHAIYPCSGPGDDSGLP